MQKDACYSLGFEGVIYPPGAKIERRELGDPAVVLECAGPVGEFRRRQRETLWVLWRYDRSAGEWREIGRAVSATWEWANVLRKPAYDALHVRPGLYEVLDLSRNLAGEIAEAIAARLNGEPADVRGSVLAALYDRLAGEIARLAA